MAPIIAYLLANYPTIFAVLAILFSVIFATYKAIRYHDRLVKTEEKCTKLHDTHFPDLNTKFGGIDTKLGSLIISVNKISTYIITDKKLDSQIFVAHSPLELTELGIKILNIVGGKKYIDDNAGMLISIMEKQNFKSGLDVQNYSNILLVEKSNDDAFTAVKNYVFQNPVYKLENGTEFPIEMSLCFNIMGIYLRNKYFEKYPELKKDL